MKRIGPLDNEIEAQILGGMLVEDEIPHTVVSYHDTVYDGIFQAQFGWGHVEVNDENEHYVTGLLEEIRASREGDDEEE